MSELTYQNKRLTFFRYNHILLPPAPGSMDKSEKEAYAIYFLEGGGTALRMDVVKEKMPDAFFTASDKEKTEILQSLLANHPPYQVAL